MIGNGYIILFYFDWDHWSKGDHSYFYFLTLSLHSLNLVSNTLFDCLQSSFPFKLSVHTSTNVNAVDNHFFSSFLWWPFDFFLILVKKIARVLFLWNFDISRNLIFSSAKLALPKRIHFRIDFLLFSIADFSLLSWSSSSRARHLTLHFLEFAWRA